MTTPPDRYAPADLATVTSLPVRPGAPGHTRRATYTVAEVADLLGMSRATVYVLLSAGQIPARRIGSRWIIARHRFDTWLNDTPTPLTSTGTETHR